MDISDIELCASYWTIAGNTFPGAPSEVSPFPLRERAEIAGRVGWRGMGLVHADLAASIAQEGIDTVRSLFADNGIRHVELEFLVDWHLDDAKRVASDTTFSEMLDIASRLEVSKIKLGAGLFEDAAPDLPRMRDAIARIGERAAPLGIDIVVEFLPFASVNSIDRALALTQNLGVENVGILVDTWHVQRGGMHANDIRAIPPALLKAVELNDADLDVVDSLFNDSTHHRRLCGEGAIDLHAQIQAILDVGYRGYWGVEVISAEHRRLPLEQAARRAFDTTMAQFEHVRFSDAIAA
ncbi:sugar phosphate isomerase/epimerase [Xanthomonas arboricola]|uniref:sugar phosphate isomerase/epimerase family protein n=1 Tax=Xanthomonas TaxID=338 RepID=UPI000CEEC7EF|nr:MULTISPECIES: sugar phosphate isomerase/epimerase family protein [Xanthomonas]MBB5737677.1 sugar phosphate isomerase/epimerase [Xanthomonas sp. CFBP 8152]PPT73830.1 xylose isomerase [Xanthomonas arboricola]